MFRFSFLKHRVGFLLGAGMIAWTGCETQRVYEYDTPSWIQQATGQVDLNAGTGWEEENGEREEIQTEISRAQDEQWQTEEAREGPAGVRYGPPKISVRVEGQDY